MRSHHQHNINKTLIHPHITPTFHNITPPPQFFTKTPTLQLNSSCSSSKKVAATVVKLDYDSSSTSSFSSARSLEDACGSEYRISSETESDSHLRKHQNTRDISSRLCSTTKTPIPITPIKILKRSKKFKSAFTRHKDEYRPIRTELTPTFTLTHKVVPEVREEKDGRKKEVALVKERDLVEGDGLEDDTNEKEFEQLKNLPSISTISQMSTTTAIGTIATKTTSLNNSNDNNNNSNNSNNNPNNNNSTNYLPPILTQKRAKFLLDHVSVTDVSCDQVIITVRECPTEDGFFGGKG